MLKNIFRRANINSPFQNEWGLQAGNKRIIVGYNVIKDNMAMTINIQKARFTMKDNYFSVKQRGYASVEFTPFIESPNEPSRKSFSLKDKKSIVLFPDSIFEFLTGKPVNVEYRKERDGEVYRLHVTEKAPNWEWTLEITGNQTDYRKLSLKPSEQYYITRLFDYSVPYIFGWYALGDSRLAEQSLTVEPEGKDPFENI